MGGSESKTREGGRGLINNGDSGGGGHSCPLMGRVKVFHIYIFSQACSHVRHDTPGKLLVTTSTSQIAAYIRDLFLCANHLVGKLAANSLIELQSLFDRVDVCAGIQGRDSKRK